MRNWKTFLAFLVLAVITIFCAYQIYSGWAYGEIRFASRGAAWYVRFDSHPFWFLFSIGVYALIPILFGALIYLVVSSKTRWRKILRKLASKPPLDNARREPTDRDS